jgi:hypothetical protein
MFGIFKGECSAMLISECTKAKANLPEFCLRSFSEHKEYGFLKMSVNRTIPTGSFDCRQPRKKYSIFNYLEIKNKTFCAWHNF